MLVHNALLQMAIYDGLFMATFDTIAAYLYQTYPEQIKPLYIMFPKKLAEACGLDPKDLYRVKKYLYGLPDAGLAYYQAYSEHLLQNGYMRSSYDMCLFMRFDASKNLRTYVWLHVDDTFITSTHQEEIERFHEVLQLKFKVTIDKEVLAYLGINLEHRSDGSTKLTQDKLQHDILNEYSSESKIDSNNYLRLLGQLSYLTHSRPDLMTMVAYHATKANDPTENDCKSLLKIVNYLRQTPDKGLILYP